MKKYRIKTVLGTGYTHPGYIVQVRAWCQAGLCLIIYSGRWQHDIYLRHQQAF